MGFIYNNKSDCGVQTCSSFFYFLCFLHFFLVKKIQIQRCILLLLLALRIGLRLLRVEIGIIVTAATIIVVIVFIFLLFKVTFIIQSLSCEKQNCSWHDPLSDVMANFKVNC